MSAVTELTDPASTTRPGRAGRPQALLLSKLSPPMPSRSQVARTNVCELVRMSQAAKLILVRAPAGFGKTTAMAQCRVQIDETGTDTAWLTLENGDNDASRFLASLGAAVAHLTGEHTFRPELTTPAQRGSLGDVARGIIGRMAAHSAPFLLILDDFENVQEPAVLELVRELIDHLPRRGRLMIGSRGLPGQGLGLGRLRARGQLLEIDASLLRFSIAETEEFLIRRRQIDLSDDDLAELHRKTEGWIAALWLASMTLDRRDGRSEFIARFSGAHEAVADYLAGDVLARQPVDVRDFLLRTSILRHLNASLCDALLGRQDGLQLLHHLETANLFLLPAEGTEHFYRYHKMFADFLRAQLARDMPDQMLQLHRAASNWYEARGDFVSAIGHALDGRNYAHALTMLSQCAEPLLEEGRMRLLTRWFAAFPETYLRNSPLLQVCRVWALCFTRGPREAMALLESSQCATSDDAGVRAHVLALRPAMLAMMDRNEEAYVAGTEALAQLPLAKSFAERALANAMASIFCYSGRYRDSHLLLDAARRQQGERTSFFHRMYSESIEGIIDLEQGRLRQATARFRMAVNSTHAATCTHTHGNAFAGVLYADALYEVNDLDQAARLLRIYVPLAKEVGLPDHMIVGYLRLARIAFSGGDIDMMFHHLAELEYLGHQRQLPRVVASAKLERARVLLLQGNKSASEEELFRADDRALWARVGKLRLPAHDLEYFELGQMRWEIQFGNAAEVVPQLDADIALAAASLRHRRGLKLQVLKCLALRRSGDKRSALACMHAVLGVACKEGFHRLIIDEGEGAGALVRQVAESAREKARGCLDPSFGEYLRRLLHGFGGPGEGEEPDTLVQPGHNEMLTSKEHRVLLLLADGYSNSALSEKLLVSDSTVRSHLRSISAKLNAQSRTQAVAIARRLGII